MDDVRARGASASRVRSPPWGLDDLQAEARPRSICVKRFMFGFCVVLCGTAVLWPALPRRYEASASVVLRPTDREGLSDSTQTMRLPLDENAIQSEIDIISSTAIADVIIRKHQIALDPEFNGTGGALGTVKVWLRSAVPGTGPLEAPSQAALRRALRSHMVIVRDRKSYTVKIGFWSADPAKATALAETFLAAYLDDQLDRKRKAANSLSGWLWERVTQLRAGQETSETAVRDFMVQSGLIDRGAQTSLEALLTTLSKEAAATRAQAIDASTRAGNLATMQSAGTLDSAPEVLASPTVQKLKESLAAALGRPAVMSPEHKALSEQLAAEAGRIARSVEIEAKNLVKRESALQEQIKSIRGALIQRLQAEIKLERLQREAANDRAVLEEALTRLKGRVASSMGIRPDVDVIATPETPTRAVFPNVPLSILGTLLAACLAGAAMNWRVLLTGSRWIMAT